MQLFCQEIAEAINEGKNLREQDADLLDGELRQEVSEEEKREILDEALSEEDDEFAKEFLKEDENNG